MPVPSDLSLQQLLEDLNIEVPQKPGDFSQMPIYDPRLLIPRGSIPQGEGEAPPMHMSPKDRGMYPEATPGAGSPYSRPIPGENIDITGPGSEMEDVERTRNERQQLIERLIPGGVPPVPEQNYPIQGVGPRGTGDFMVPGFLGEMNRRPTQQELIQMLLAGNEPRDLDRRTPPPLPIIDPTHSVAPHNPNPPMGGVGNTLRPGERLGGDPQEFIAQLLAQG